MIKELKLESKQRRILSITGTLVEHLSVPQFIISIKHFFKYFSYFLIIVFGISLTHLSFKGQG